MVWPFKKKPEPKPLGLAEAAEAGIAMMDADLRSFLEALSFTLARTPGDRKMRLYGLIGIVTAEAREASVEMATVITIIETTWKRTRGQRPCGASREDHSMSAVGDVLNENGKRRT